MGKAILITVSEAKPDPNGNIFEFRISTTTEQLFLPTHFKVFKKWMKNSTEKIVTERAKKNIEIRRELLLKKDLLKAEALKNPTT